MNFFIAYEKIAKIAQVTDPYKFDLPLLIVKKELFELAISHLLDIEVEATILDLRGVSARDAISKLDLNWRAIRDRYPAEEDHTVDKPLPLVVLLGSDPYGFGHERFLKYICRDGVVYDGVVFPPGDDKCFAIPVGARLFGIIEQQVFDSECPKYVVGACVEVTDV